jgi:hypothetical protein
MYNKSALLFENSMKKHIEKHPGFYYNNFQKKRNMEKPVDQDTFARDS